MNVVVNDALSYIDSFDDNFFDFIILDPDYQDWNNLIANGIIEKSMNKLKSSGNILCFTKQPFDYQLRIAIDKYFRREIVWTFENGGAWCSPKMPLVSTQKIYWIVKSKDFYFNPRTGIEYSKNTRDFKRTKKVWQGFEADGKDFVKSDDGIWLRDHLHYNKPNCGSIPAKPKELIQIFLRCFCPSNGIVLDAFTGSGIVPLLCDEMDLHSYACDIDKERVENIINGNVYKKTKDIKREKNKRQDLFQMNLFDYIN